MKRFWLVTAILMISLALPLSAVGQGMTTAEPISGSAYYPDGTQAEQASFLFEYQYPQFVVQSESDERINAYYQSVAQDMTGALFEQMALDAMELWTEGMPPARTQIDYQLTHNDERYLSVLLTSRQMIGNGESESLSANTFARDGVYAGQPITLSQVLGLEETDDALSDQPSLAEQLAYTLIWEIVKDQSANIDGDYLDGLSLEAVEKALSPETDFYLDENNNVVFFIQSGVLAGEVAGALLFPFAREELLSAVNP